MELLDLLRDLVSFDTTIDPASGKRPDPRAFEYLLSAMRSAGLSVRRIESNGIISLLGSKGSGRPVVLLMAHVDTVPFVGQQWTRDPLLLTIEGDRAYGRGTLDDKGNVAASLWAAERLEPSRGTLLVAFTGDEEIGGENGARAVKDLLLSENMRPDYVINADGNSMVVINRRRAVFIISLRARVFKTTVRGTRRTLRLELRGGAGDVYHAAYFTPGVDSHPLLSLSKLVSQQGLYLISVRGPFIKSNVLPAWVEAEIVEPCSGCPEQEVDLGLTELIRALLPASRTHVQVKGYSSYGVTATPNYYRSFEGTHEVLLDLRAISDDAESVKAAVRQAVEDYVGEGVEVAIESHGGYLLTPRDSRLVNEALVVLRSLGVEPRVAEMAGASDSGHFSPLGMEVIDFGPLGGNIHGPDEYVSLSSLKLTARFYLELANRLLR